MERTFNDLTLGIHAAAHDLVLLPIASLTLYVAIRCIPTFAAILHRSYTSEMATITCAYHVLRLDEYLTHEMSRKILPDIQLYEKSTNFFLINSNNASEL
jgi:hypothetical protein